jgi:hypothetical protein
LSETVSVDVGASQGLYIGSGCCLHAAQHPAIAKVPIGVLPCASVQ